MPIYNRRFTLGVCAVACAAMSHRATSQPSALASVHGTVTQQMRLELTAPVVLNTVVLSDQGGYAAGIVTQDMSAGRKHLGGIQNVPIRLQESIGPLMPLMVHLLSPSAGLLNGRVSETVMPTSPGATSWQMAFTNAVPVRLSILPLDAGAMGNCVVELTLAPQKVELLSATSSPTPITKQAPPCLESNFRLSIAGIRNGAPLRVSHIDSITLVRRATATNALAFQQAAVPIWECENVRLTVSEADAPELYQWYEEFVIKGNNGVQQEKTLELQLLDGAMHPVAVLHAQGVGVVSFHPLSSDGSASQIRRVELELYVNGWQITQ